MQVKPMVNLWKRKTIFTFADKFAEGRRTRFIRSAAGRIIHTKVQPTVEPEPIAESDGEPITLPFARKRMS